MLDYYLEPNLLTADDPNDYRAQVANVRSYTEADIIKMMLDRGAGLRESDILSVLSEYKKVCSGVIADGNAIVTEMWIAHPSIPGVYSLTSESVGGVKTRLSPGKLFREAAAEVKTRKVTPSRTGTIIEGTIDVRTGSVSDKLTPERDLRISGIKLKIAGESPENGVYFVNAAGERVKVEPADIVENNPSGLLVVVPALTAGTYQLQIVTQFSGGGKLSGTPRTTTFNKPLTVAAPGA